MPVCSVHLARLFRKDKNKQRIKKTKKTKGIVSPTPLPTPKSPPKKIEDERAKAEAFERELVKAFPPLIDDPDLSRVIRDGDPEPMLRKLVPTPLPVIPKPCVITAGDVDNFQYNPKTDKVFPCCIKVPSRNFDEPGVNKPFSHQVRIPCCKILAIRCEVRIRNEGELSYNDRVYVAIPGTRCRIIWYSDINALNSAWPGKPGQAFTLSWWLPPVSVKHINHYIFEEAQGCDCFLCLLSQDDHAVDYWRLYVYCCECCPTGPRPAGSMTPLEPGSQK